MFLEGFFAVLSNLLLFTSRLDNTNTFPHPLSPEKEREFLKKFKENGDISARDTLIKHNLRLVVFIAKKYTNYPDRDELISIGTMGLIKAINSYSDGKGTCLATYASRCIENEILMAMRSYKKNQNNVSIYENVGADKDGNDVTLIDMLKVDEESVYVKLENELTRATLLRLMKTRLSERERIILIDRFGMGNDVTPLTQQEISEKLNISRSYVSRIEKGALEKLKRAIIEENIEF